MRFERMVKSNLKFNQRRSKIDIVQKNGTAPNCQFYILHFYALFLLNQLFYLLDRS